MQMGYSLGGPIIEQLFDSLATRARLENSSLRDDEEHKR